jgi:UvrD-like helicase family protein
MAAVLARHVLGLIQRPEDGITVADGSWRWRISVEALRRVVDDVRREQPPYGAGRERVRARTVALLQRQAEARRGDSPPESWLRKMGRHPEVRGFLDHVWPEVTPEQIVFTLLTDPDALAAAADGILSADEQKLLGWGRPPRTVKSAHWSAADAVLIDEASGLIERQPSFGHVVVDEAQDHSAMELRVLARRSPQRSMTILGDLAQATATGAQSSWPDALGVLDAPHGRIAELELGYRVPGPVLDYANRLLPSAAPGVLPSRSVRQVGTPPSVVRCESFPEVVVAIVDAVRREHAEGRSIGVIAPTDALDAVAGALEEAGLAFTDARGASGLRERITLIPPESVKGLEFDAVVVAEPGAIAASGEHGLRLLFIALTRAVRTLTVVHTGAVPAPLR